MTNKKQSEKGLRFSRHFTKEGTSPYDMFEYDYRTSVIKNTSGEIVFQMDNVEVPRHGARLLQISWRKNISARREFLNLMGIQEEKLL